MRSLSKPTNLVAAAGIAAAACLGEIDEDLPKPTGGGGTDGGSLTSGCVGACCPESVDCYPEGNPTAPGSECLALRDNRGKDRVMLATVWRRNLLPTATTADITYSFLLLHSTLPLPQCNMKGQSGFVQLFEWDRSNPVITEQTVRTGFAAWVHDGNEVIDEGLCFLDFMHVDPPWRTTPVHVKPTTARRVAEDFDPSDPAFRQMMKGKEEGVFYYDEEKGVTHGYGDKGWVVIFESEKDVLAIPIHEVETSGHANNPDVLNCAGRYRGDALDPNAASPCQASAQDDPPYGCIDDECEPGLGPGRTTGYFLIEELEDVHNTILNMTLCVNYMGQQRAIDEGWANPDDWGLNCRGSPAWKSGKRPKGDWCSKTNAPATADCADAWRSESVGTLAAMPIREGTCTTDAQ